MSKADLHVPTNPVRFVTAASLFDGHDASINIMRRILQSQGAEVVHLGHNRSVDEVVDAAICEDVQGVAISSYQGGHVEYFEYLVDLLAERGAGHVHVYGGGGGVIVPAEIARLREHGVRIFSPEDGQRLGLAAMVNTMVADCDTRLADLEPASWDGLLTGDRLTLARALTMAEVGALPDAARERVDGVTRQVPVLGITGTGGSGKSSLTDELLRRFRLDQGGKVRIAVLAVDPTRRRGGGALLGDRIRMNSITGEGASSVFFRSMATRGTTGGLPEHLDDVVAVLKASGVDLVVVETPGIGQGDAAIVPFCDTSLYVMTPEYGASSQLEKIDMLDFADAVAINKFERRGAEDARRDVARQLVRNREAFGSGPDEMPVYGTSAATFNDDGVTALYQFLRDRLAGQGLGVDTGLLPEVAGKVSTSTHAIIPPARVRYLSDIAETVRGYHRTTQEQVLAARRVAQLRGAATALDEADADRGGLDDVLATAENAVAPTTRALLEAWPATVRDYSGEELVVTVREREIHTALQRLTLSGNPVRRVALPRVDEDGELVRFLRSENLPGHFPYTAGVFAFKREGEDPARMFAGEGDAFRTNRRFQFLSRDGDATRLSTAFDSVTLYGFDPGTRPDIYGKVGTSGVSIATLDDMKALYDGFDLTSPSTSVSMTINGPAPTILAFFLNAAIDAETAKFQAAQGRPPSPEEADVLRGAHARHRPRHGAGRHPQGGPGPEHLHLHHRVLAADDGRHPGVVHPAAGAQLLLGVDQRVPHRRGRGEPHQPARVHPRQRLHLRGVVPGPRHEHRRLRAEPVVLLLQRDGRRVHRDRPGGPPDLGGRDARPLRRQRAVAEAEVPRADLGPVAARAGDGLQRHPHDAAGAVRDLRQRNSLHTNAYDEAVTTPTDHSVRRALAIQMIINREWGLSLNENPLQGSYVVDELTDLVEEAVLAEFDRLTERGGVLGAMETGYQRGRIQDESMLYEQRKHDGSLPLVGVNTFLDPHPPAEAREIELARGTEAEKQSQLDRLADFTGRHRTEAEAALARLREAATTDENLFAVLMDAARVCSLGQVTEAFFEVGGQYRRSV